MPYSVIQTLEKNELKNNWHNFHFADCNWVGLHLFNDDTRPQRHISRVIIGIIIIITLVFLQKF